MARIMLYICSRSIIPSLEGYMKRMHLCNDNDDVASMVIFVHVCASLDLLSEWIVLENQDSRVVCSLRHSESGKQRT